MEPSSCASSCPFVSGRPEPLGFPVGQVRRVVMAQPGENGEVDETKRNVLKLLAVAGLVGAGAGGLAGGALQFIQPPTIGISSYPRVQLIDVDGSPLTVAKVESEYNVETSSLYLFNYPLRNEPNFLLNVYPASGAPNAQGTNGADNVVNGIGTHKSIVALVRSANTSDARRPRSRSTLPGPVRTPRGASRSTSIARATGRPMTSPSGLRT